jgi:hypothetical protein
MVEGSDPMSDPRHNIFAFLSPYLKPPGWNSRELLEGMDKQLDLLGVPRASPDAPQQASEPVPASDSQTTGEALSEPENGIPDDYWPMLAQIESGNRPYVKASSSSASGLYQFVKATWLQEGGEWGSNMALAFGGLKPSIEEQLQRAKSFTEKNAKVLRGLAVPINRASLYAAHFLGVYTAAKVIAAEVDARADVIAGPAPTAANPSILKGKTVGDFLSWLHDKTGDWAR